ncbi:MAG: hypothetical protein ACLFV8_00285 [Alphaproteobacteria bacterium]
MTHAPPCGKLAQITYGRGMMRVQTPCMVLLAAMGAMSVSGCFSRFEHLAACHEAHGGTQYKCDKYNERRADREQRRDAIRRNKWFATQTAAKTRKNWRAELADARRENHAAIAAKYSQFGWLSGAWCSTGEDGSENNVRIRFLDRETVRLARFQWKPSKNGKRASKYFSKGKRHLRSGESTVEVWGVTEKSKHSDHTWARLDKFRKGPGGNLIYVSQIYYVPDTADPQVPFSGTRGKEYGRNIEFRRCG